MQVEYDGETYDLNFDDITLKQIDVIQNATGLSLGGIQAGLADGDAGALRALYWLMLVNNGKKVDISNVDFKIVKFAQAVQAASDAEDAAAEAKAKAAKKPAR